MNLTFLWCETEIPNKSCRVSLRNHHAKNRGEHSSTNFLTFEG